MAERLADLKVQQANIEVQRARLTTEAGPALYLAATRVEKKIVKVPKNDVVVVLGGSKALVTNRVDLEDDLAIHKQREKLDPGKTALPTELFDLLRRGQYGDGGCNLRSANFEQCSSAR